jgi:hypothetical protein
MIRDNKDAEYCAQIEAFICKSISGGLSPECC